MKCGCEIWLLFENATPMFTFCGLTSAGAQVGPGPGAHRPEAYGALGARPISAPRSATLETLRKPYVNSRLEVRARGTPPSIPAGTRTVRRQDQSRSAAAAVALRLPTRRCTRG